LEKDSNGKGKESWRFASQIISDEMLKRSSLKFIRESFFLEDKWDWRQWSLRKIIEISWDKKFFGEACEISVEKVQIRNNKAWKVLNKSSKSFSSNLQTRN
jgi:hypothetical protein